MKYFLKRGFTLIELMMVIAIIGILASIIVVSLSSSKAKGRDAKRVSDIRTIQLALEEYYNDNAYYPTSLYGAGISPPFSTYLSPVPTDPSTGGSYKFSAYNSPLNAICTTGNKPVAYHLAAVTECNDSSSNTSCPTYSFNDADAIKWDSGATPCTGTTANFDGTSVGCANTTGGGLSGDNCYDVTN